MAERPVPDFPNIRHCQLLCEAVRSGSVSRAAERLNITQPAASQGIAGLERDLGAALLSRQAGGTIPTEQGRLFAERAGRALGYLREGAAHVLKKSGRGRENPDRLVRIATAAQLRALIAVADAGSFTVAAHEIGLAQPTVHRAAREIEANFATELFRQRPGGVGLTPAGEVVVRMAKLARAEFRQIREEFANLAGVGRPTFVLGSLPLARSRIVPGAIHAMIYAHPGAQVRVIDGRYAELLRGLREGDIDCLIGALREPTPANDVDQEALFVDDLVIIAGRGHPLAGRGSVSFEDTLAHPWIAPPKDTPSGQYLFDALGIQDRPRTPVRVVSSSLVLLRALLLRGDYVTIISHHQVRDDLERGDLVVLPLELADHRREIGLTTRHRWFPTATQNAFIDLLRAEARRSERAG